MAKANDFGVITMGRFARKAGEAGWEPGDMELIASDQELMENLILVSYGLAEVRPKEPILPKGGRIRIVRNVPVDESREWSEALRALPQTTSQSGVWKVGESFPPTIGAKVVKRDIILASFGLGSFTSSEKALEWGEAHGLQPITPREAFAIAEHRPNLHRDLGLGFMSVVSLLTCSFAGESRVCYSWWDGAKREADIHRFTHSWSGGGWFGFVREPR